MNKQEYFLACISEEAGEVTQMVGKCQRFGIYGSKGTRGTTNFEELRKEVHDVVATYELLCERLDIDSSFERELIQEKKDKVIRLMESSRRHGHLHD